MTISPAAVQAAIAKRLEEAFPGEAVYTDQVPPDFRRPCNLAELTELTFDPLSLGQSAVKIQYRCRITTFCAADEPSGSPLPELRLRSLTVLGIFANGFLPVRNRALKVTALSADTSRSDSAAVTLTLELAAGRADFRPAELLPVMQNLTARYTEKEDTST